MDVKPVAGILEHYYLFCPLFNAVPLLFKFLTLQNIGLHLCLTNEMNVVNVRFSLD